MSETEYNAASLMMQMLYELGLILYHLQAIHALLFTESHIVHYIPFFVLLFPQLLSSVVVAML